MSDYANQLKRFRFWNRAAIRAFLCVPAIFVICSVIASATALPTDIAIGAMCALFLVFIFIAVAYIQIRAFRCPRCGRRFAVAAFGVNTRGRQCAHCGLEAYSKP